MSTISVITDSLDKNPVHAILDNKTVKPWINPFLRDAMRMKLKANLHSEFKTGVWTSTQSLSSVFGQTIAMKPSLINGFLSDFTLHMGVTFAGSGNIEQGRLGFLYNAIEQIEFKNSSGDVLLRLTRESQQIKKQVYVKAKDRDIMVFQDSNGNGPRTNFATGSAMDFYYRFNCPFEDDFSKMINPYHLQNDNELRIEIKFDALADIAGASVTATVTTLEINNRIFYLPPAMKDQVKVDFGKLHYVPLENFVVLTKAVSSTDTSAEIDLSAMPGIIDTLFFFLRFDTDTGTNHIWDNYQAITNFNITAGGETIVPSEPHLVNLYNFMHHFPEASWTSWQQAKPIYAKSFSYEPIEYKDKGLYNSRIGMGFNPSAHSDTKITFNFSSLSDDGYIYCIGHTNSLLIQKPVPGSTRPYVQYDIKK